MDFREKFAMSLDYIFGRGVSSVLPLDRLEFSFSKRTGRVKTVLLDGRLLATIRSDGSIAFTVYGAGLLVKHQEFLENCVVVEEGPDRFVAEGRSVFAKHVVRCGDRVRPASDVAILDVKGKVIAVGKAVLSAKMMREFDRGVAVKVRESVGKGSSGEANA
ncbi:MAG: PUA domain-containing protein [Nitrososphaerales archaeon]